ncbi:unnamed protein product [Gongylonema pulchrum]|uniref:IgGFc_binding domain-containing protein n=1 Tax=Gongylonema pulchrum TaxID=637853 RepID=A0A183CZM6_9BILA|nr:unnamed protein product [Gongylonema pulchrum]
MLRYGGYERQTGGYISGAFLDMLPSRTQFVTAGTAFSVLSDSNLITIIGDEKTKDTAVFDNFYEIVWAPISYLDEVMYYAASSVPSGYHNLYSEGDYIVFVTGTIDGVAYSQKWQPMPVPRTTTPSPQCYFVIPFSSERETAEQSASITIINPGDLWNNVTIRYLDGKETHRTVLYLTPLSSRTVEIPSSALSFCKNTGTGFAVCPDTRINVSSLYAISLFVNSYSLNMSGDSFLGKYDSIGCILISKHSGSFIFCFF